MTQPFLYMRRQGTTPTQYAVFKEINMQLVQVGSDFGSDEGNAENSAYNRVAHWGNDLYAIGTDEIWKYDVAAGGPWTSFHSYANKSAFAQANNTFVGFSSCSIDGSGVLAMGYAGPGQSEITLVKIDRDGNATETAGNAITGADWNIATEFMIGSLGWRNNLVFRHTKSIFSRLAIYDVAAEAVANIATAAPGNEHMQHSQVCISNDKIYSVTCYSFDNPILTKVVGTSEVSQGFLTTTIADTLNTIRPYWGSALCELDDKLFAFIPSDDGTGFECVEVILDSVGDAIAFNDVTSIVLPASLTGFNTGSETHAMIRIDNTTNSGIAPIYELVVYENNTEGTGPTLYRWNNAPSGQMTIVDGGMDNYQFDKMDATNGTAGERVWSGSGVINASAPLLTINGSNVDAEFTIYGAGQTVSLEIVYDKEGETTSAIGTITSTTVGSIVSNQVTGLTADGVTKVTVTWAAALDGVVSGDNPKVAARIFIP